MEIIRDLPYTDSRSARNAYDLYLPDNADTLLIYFYGGSLKKGEKGLQKFALPFSDASGIAVAVPDYRLIPEVGYPDFIIDAADAVSAIVRNYGNRFRSIFVGGHSAGAYLSMMLCFDRSYLGEALHNRICGWCFISGQPTKHFSVLEAAGLDTRRIIVDDTSALWYVGESCPPVLIVVSDCDIENRLEQNRLLYGTLKHFGNADRTTLEIIYGVTHGALTKPDANGKLPVYDILTGFIRKFGI